VSVYAGFLLALPVILWQLWSFLAPAFDPSIERSVLGLVSFATALGAAGLAFGYWIVLPRALQWLTHYDDTHFTNLIQAKAYYSFTSTVLLGIVMVFELPIVVLGLVSIGAGAFTLAQMHRNRELVAMLAAGVSMQRIAMPFIADHGRLLGVDHLALRAARGALRRTICGSMVGGSVLNVFVPGTSLAARSGCCPRCR